MDDEWDDENFLSELFRLHDESLSPRADAARGGEILALVPPAVAAGRGFSPPRETGFRSAGTDGLVDEWDVDENFLAELFPVEDERVASAANPVSHIAAAAHASAARRFSPPRELSQSAYAASGGDILGLGPPAVAAASLDSNPATPVPVPNWSSSPTKLNHGDIISLRKPPRDGNAVSCVGNGATILKRKPGEVSPGSKRLKGLGIGSPCGPVSLDDVRRLEKSNSKSANMGNELRELKKELENEKVEKNVPITQQAAPKEAWEKISGLETEIAATIRDLSNEKQRYREATERIILHETQLRSFYSTTEEISRFAKGKEQLIAADDTHENTVEKCRSNSDGDLPNEDLLEEPADSEEVPNKQDLTLPKDENQVLRMEIEEVRM